MNKQDNAALREHIYNRINDLVTIANQEQAGLAPDAASANAQTDATAMSVTPKISEHEKKELAQLKANLAWLDSDDGGYCDSCCCEIPVARLHAVPSTRLCVDCAQ